MAAPVQLRLIEAVLPASAWHSEHTQSLKEVHSVLSKINNEAADIKVMIATLALTEVFARATTSSTQAKDEEQVVNYVRGKLGLKDVSVFGKALSDRLCNKTKGKSAGSESTGGGVGGGDSKGSSAGSRAMKRFRRKGKGPGGDQ